MSVGGGHTGAGDCERCRPGLVAQPVNTVSSLAFVVVGAATVRGAAARGPIEQAVSWSAIAAGVGSVAFHGPGGQVGKLVHDAGLLSLLGSISVADWSQRSGRPVGWPAAALVPVAAVAVARSRANEAAQVVAGVVTGLAEVWRITANGRHGNVEDWVIAPTAALGGLAHLFGRTGGPLCAPESLLQPHAVWHLSTAATVWLRARSIARVGGRAGKDGDGEG